MNFDENFDELVPECRTCQIIMSEWRNPIPNLEFHQSQISVPLSSTLFHTFVAPHPIPAGRARSARRRRLALRQPPRGLESALTSEQKRKSVHSREREPGMGIHHNITSHGLVAKVMLKRPVSGCVVRTVTRKAQFNLEFQYQSCNY